jgi:hypothetical protein
MPDLVRDEAVREALQDALGAASSHSAWARDHDMSRAVLYRVLRGQPAPYSLASVLGFRRVVAFEKRES